MKVTVCELSDNETDFLTDWNDLILHAKNEETDLILLPEMPFCQWVAAKQDVNDEAKKESIEKHEAWLLRLDELETRYVVYSKPVLAGSKYYNTAYIYEKGKGHREIHTKYFFPEEPHFWEDTWYDRKEKEFKVLDLGGLKVGVLLCTELWFTEYARSYGQQGADLLLCPRATGAPSLQKWLRLGQTLSVISGAYCLSSNRAGYDDTNHFQWAGTGWIIEPGTGDLLASTGSTAGAEKFVTVDIDLAKTRDAKFDYPLIVRD